MEGHPYAKRTDAKTQQQTDIAIDTRYIEDGEKYHTRDDRRPGIKDILTL
jgi:hypothetical protein